MEINRYIYSNIIEQANERKRVQIECAVWHLDVGLAHPHERRNHEGFDCSSIKELHELGLIRRETVWFLSSRGNWSKIKIAPLYERNWVCWPMVRLLFIRVILLVIPFEVTSIKHNMLSLKYIYNIGMARKLRQLKVSAESI